MTNVLLVTGGGRGIGAAVSRLAAARGYAVCVNFRADADAAQQVVRAITAAEDPAAAARSLVAALAAGGSEATGGST